MSASAAVLAALRAYPPSDPRWDRRAGEIFALARKLAFAARADESTAPDDERHWMRLPAHARNAWTIAAWNAVTGGTP